MNELEACPYCGSVCGYYTKDYVYGAIRHYNRFDGEPADNHEMYDYVSHKSGKYMYCTDCDKRLFKIDDAG